MLVALTSLAASVSDRSPFAQGHWWDPTHSGSGFELFNAAGQVAVVWYTYDEAGRPVWYTAQGDIAGLGTQSWPLLKHRWTNGRRGDQTIVGSLKLALRHPEGIDVAWTVNGKPGTWAIQPLIVSGVVNEVDHSGEWFDPANGGWGLTVTEQGDVLGGAVFTYDASGEATWVAGFQHTGNRSVEYFTCTGSCPSCNDRVFATRSVGSLAFDFRSETDMTVRSALSVAMAPGVNVDGAKLTPLSRPASWRSADRQLASYDSAAALKAYLVAGMLNVPRAYSGVDFSPAPPAAATLSTTNLQEAGVDEADLVKTNGQAVYTFANNGGGMTLPTVRVAQVRDDGMSLQMLGSVNLASGPATPMANAGLYLDGDSLVAVTGTFPSSGYVPSWLAMTAWMHGVTHVELMSTASAALPVTRWRLEVDGHLVASRRIGQKLYLVTRFTPYLPGFAYGATTQPQLGANQQLLAATPASALLPRMRSNDDDPVAIATSAVYVPPQGARLPMANMMVVTVIDLGEPHAVQALAIVGTVDAVYASTANLYLASSRYDYFSATGSLLPSTQSFYLTDIHQVRLDAGGMAIAGSASVEGFLGSDPDKAAFRMSEYQGRLRTVTSNPTMWGGVVMNRLTVLEPSSVAPGLLRTVSFLPNAKRPEPLGKPSEVLYGTRFVGDRLYAVSFKKIDPLYVVDIADASDPKITGALSVPGFSDYLHPLPNGLLLGFGKDARPTDVSGDGQFAWYQGLMLTLFDVGDVGKPREVQRMVIGKRGSDSALLRSHHAFSALMQSDSAGTIAIPASIHDGPSPQFGSGDSAYYPWMQSGLLRFALQGTGASDTRLVQLPGLITQSMPMQSMPGYDAAATAGRSVLLRSGTVYVGNGQFWLRDAGGATTGPY
ncbi:MAG: beta-propeller domain-containing protein [Usitatibacter sp.]